MNAVPLVIVDEIHILVLQHILGKSVTLLRIPHKRKSDSEMNIRFCNSSKGQFLADSVKGEVIVIHIRGLVRCEGLVIFTDTDKLSVKFKKLLLERRLNVMYLYSRCGNRIGGFEISITVVDADYVCVVKSDHRVPPFWSAMPFY